jgi:GT2 family glycosyltransferase
MRIVIPTQKTEEEYWASDPGRTVKAAKHLTKVDIKYQDEDWFMLKDNFDVDVIEKNETGLGKLYNQYLNDESDIIVFMHDDLEIHDLFFYEKLVEAHKHYDVVGLAGASRQEYKKDVPSLWHMACNQFRMVGNKMGEGRGFVSHKHLHGLSFDWFGQTPAPTVFIDGLFMSFNMKRVKETGFTFDEDFEWHHYDITACLRAKEKGLSMGVWPIFAVHHGLGEWNTPEWHKSDKLFKEKYVR